MDKKSMKSIETRIRTTTTMGVAEKIGVLVMMAASLCLAGGLIFGLFIRIEQKLTPQKLYDKISIEVNNVNLNIEKTLEKDGGDFTKLSIPNSTFFNEEIGSPQFPYIRKMVEIPTQATDIKIVARNTGDIIEYNDILVYPTPKKIPKESDEGLFNLEDEFYINNTAYEKDNYSPGKLAEVTKDDYFRSTRVLYINVYPVQFNPIQQHVQLYSDIIVDINYTIKDSSQTLDDKMGYLESFSEQLDNASLETKETKTAIKSAGEASVNIIGSDNLMDITNEVDYLIITHDDFINSTELLDFAQYRADYDNFRIGIVSVSDIYTQFPNANGNDYSMQDFVTYAYHNWQTPPSFLLLVGNSELVPTHSVEWDMGIYDDDDFFTYGADEDVYFESDIANLAVGRLPVDSSVQITDIKDKIESYEQGQIVNGDYHEKVAYMQGWGVGGLGVMDDLNNIGFDVTDLLQLCPEGQYCVNDVCNAFKSNFVAFTAHGSTSNIGLSNCCSANNLAWGFGFCENPQPPDCSMPAGLVDCGCCPYESTPQWNTGAVPIVMAKSCLTAQIRDGGGLATAMVKKEAKGAVAYYGASSLSEDYNFTIKAALAEMFDNFNYHLGTAILFAETEEFIDHHQLNLIGDPALHAFGHRVNTTQPELTIGRDDFSFDSEGDTLSVTVTNLGGITATNVPVEVLLYETDEIIHPFTSFTIPNIPAESDTTLNIQAVPPLRGEYLTVVKIDPSNTIEESFELNNQAAKILNTLNHSSVYILDEGGQPLSDIRVDAYDNNDNMLDVTFTDNNGRAEFYLEHGTTAYFKATFMGSNSRSYLYSDLVEIPSIVNIQLPQPSQLNMIYPEEDIINFAVDVYDNNDRNLALGFNASNLYNFYIEEDTNFYYKIINITLADGSMLPDVISNTQIAPAETTISIVSECNDGTQVGVCNNNDQLCTSTDLISCDDGDACTLDTCPVGTGNCQHDVLPNDCANRVCGDSPSGCYTCGSCETSEPYCDTETGQCIAACPDGTLYGSCSENDQYCSEGTLLEYQCGLCDVTCPIGYYCQGGQCCNKVGGQIQCTELIPPVSTPIR